MEFRATISNASVTLAPADNALVEGGALAVLTRAAIAPEVSLANLSFDEEEGGDYRELHVEFLANDNVFARRAIKRWARSTVYNRIWFADEVYEPDELPPARRVASTICRCCGLEMSDGSEGFWDMVLDCGFFPPYCFACGATVPQWTTKARQPSTRRLQRIRARRELQAGGSEDHGGSHP